MHPQAIKKYLDRFVSGQDEAKKALSVSGFIHYLNMRQTVKVNSTTLLAGPSGSGKTYLLKHLADYLSEMSGEDISVVHIDAANIVQHGFAGGTSLQEQLHDQARNLRKNKHSIILIDEIDKLCYSRFTSGGDDVNRGVQYQLLKILEGTELPGQFSVDTSNFMFIFAGNFPELRHNREQKPPLGFKGIEVDVAQEFTDELQKVGMVTQLAGRISHFAETKALDKDALLDILLNKENSVIRRIEKCFINMGIPQKLDRIAEEIAEEAIQRDTGARALEQIAIDKTRDIFFQYEPITELPGTELLNKTKPSSRHYEQY